MAGSRILSKLASESGVNGHRDFPLCGQLISLRMDRLCPCGRSDDLPGGLDQRRHSLPGGGLGEAEAGALGEDQVGVVEQTIDCGSGQGLGHDRV
jgi:hypothetical protein